MRLRLGPLALILATGIALGSAEADADAATRAAAAAMAAATAAKPRPVPSDAAQADALKVIKTTFKVDFLRHKPEEHLAFAHHLLEQAPNISDNDAARYAFLHEGCEQAAKGGDAELIRRGVQELASFFIIDANDERLRLLLATREFVSAEALVGVVEAELGIASQAIDVDDYALALKAAHGAEELARQSADAGAIANAKAVAERAKLLGDDYARLGEVADLLGNISDDGHSHLGAFQCFAKNAWHLGLAHLAAGNDDTLKALAEGELAVAGTAAPSPESQLAVAEHWWDYAQKQHGDARDGILAHAFTWYRRAIGGLGVPARAKAERRIEEIDRFLAGNSRHPLMHYPPGAAILLSCERDSLILQQDRLVGVLDISGHGLRGQAIGVKPITGAYGGALQFDGHAHLDFGNPKVLQITGSQTIALWINPDVLDERRNPIAKSYGGEGTITLEANGAVNYFYGIGGSNAQPYEAFALSPPVPVKTWTHIAVVRDLSSKRILWYRNATKVGDVAAPYPASATSTLPLLIGAGYVENFIGQLDEIGIWPRALSEGEILQLVESTAAGRR
jgi:hypothetical protein